MSQGQAEQDKASGKSTNLVVDRHRHSFLFWDNTALQEAVRQSQ
jgi:hypothetical protein